MVEMPNSAGSGKVLFSAVVITLALSLCATPPAAGAPLDPETETNVANALWMLNYDPAHIPYDIAVRLASPINADTAFGSRFRAFLPNLVADPTTFTPDYSQYYEVDPKIQTSG
jgi:hypothetical protein